MALLLFDGFDHYDGEHLDKKWEIVVQTAGPQSGGRNGGKRLYLLGDGSVTTKDLGNKGLLIAGFFFDYADGSILDLPFLQFLDGETAQLSFKMSPGIDKKIHVYRGAELLGETEVIADAGAGCYLEAYVTFSDALGIINIRKDGAQIFYYAGSTIVTANYYANRINLHGMENAVYFDDLYACDNLGTSENDFLGDCQVRCLLPDENGDTNAWIPSAGDNFECVNEDAGSRPDDDTTSVKSTATGQIDLYKFPALAETQGKVLGVQLLPYIKKIDTETRTFKTVTKTHSANYEGAAQELDEDYKYFPEIQTVNPATELPWTLEEINAAQFGIKAES